MSSFSSNRSTVSLPLLTTTCSPPTRLYTPKLLLLNPEEVVASLDALVSRSRRRPSADVGLSSGSGPSCNPTVCEPCESILTSELWFPPPKLAFPRTTASPATSSVAPGVLVPTPTFPPVGASASLFPLVTTSRVPSPSERSRLFGTNWSPLYVPNSRTSSALLVPSAFARLPMRMCACLVAPPSASTQSKFCSPKTSRASFTFTLSEDRSTRYKKLMASVLAHMIKPA